MMMSKLGRCCKFLVELNFYVAVIVLVTFCALSISDSYSLFVFNEDLYGALDNNLRMIIVYLGLLELAIVAYCWLVKNFQAMILVGFFLILMIESIDFYGEINTVAIDDSLPLLFLYTGLSHLVFGVMSVAKKNRFEHSNKTDNLS